MKVAIVGSRRWQNKGKIKDFIFKLKEQYGDELTIVSGGCKDGADIIAKKVALEFDINYVEFPLRTMNIICTVFYQGGSMENNMEFGDILREISR